MRRMFSLDQIKNIADSEVRSLVEGGTLNNAKAIYCHPITIVDDNDDYRIRMTMLIFTNDATPFTLASFITWLNNLYTQVGSNIRIMTSGAVYVKATSACVINSYLMKDAESYFITGVSASGSSTSLNKADFNEFFGNSVSFIDGVNKIN